MPIKPIKPNKPQPRFMQSRFPKEAAAFSAAWGDSAAAVNVIAGKERDRRINVCEFTAVWGSPVWGTFLTDGPFGTDARI
jgi:hypothetical protein